GLCFPDVYELFVKSFSRNHSIFDWRNEKFTSLGHVSKLSNNQIQGRIFRSKHANLTVVLFLDGKKFSGSLGKGLLKSTNLILLDMSDNRFSGRLPLWI
ncbi:LOW QUALITY PROTEIN: hypothetical protein HID58_065844, partial [Brassica napus]